MAEILLFLASFLPVMFAGVFVGMFYDKKAVLISAIVVAECVSLSSILAFRMIPLEVPGPLDYIIVMVPPVPFLFVGALLGDYIQRKIFIPHTER